MVSLFVPRDPKRFLTLFDIPIIFFYNKNMFFWETTSFLCSGPPMSTPSQPISGPCSKQIIRPRKYRIAIPTMSSSTRVYQKCPLITINAKADSFPVLQSISITSSSRRILGHDKNAMERMVGSLGTNDGR